MPLLLDDGRTVVESSVIIEHLDLAHPGPARMIPADPQAALPIRTLDRVFDHCVMTPVQTIVFEALRGEGQRDPYGVAAARNLLDTAYGSLDATLVGCARAAGDAFSLADCAAAPALFHADRVHPIPESHGTLRGYRRRLLERPSFARAVDEARPYRPNVPLGAPDRD